MALREVLATLGLQRVERASDHEHAMRAVADGIDTAFIFASLPDRLALRVMAGAACACPSPRLIVVSDGPHPDLFELARAGAHANLRWPVQANEVRVCLEEPLLAVANLDAAARPLLGRVGLRDAQNLLRYAMLRSALLAAQGSRRAAARILGVTRPAVQRMLREDAELGLPPNDADELSLKLDSAQASQDAKKPHSSGVAARRRSA